ncbi:2,4-dienoyl-CoA reductase (NADPH2) [Paenibacillus sp. UNC496MF]|uniref:oxidoreductase n=1 Tax=Paenibacillus sp. UNC496MF TaxID=1502753 RepID=UPI0008F00ADF|nr:FAD-dependent oxidoreductase [Paenibacillus sp. UNC496MF]SFJ24650.1 2,4-dienoyl-CoA reductase (NADPH2) [Paenibacillus sp. UNC496MF]
MMTTLLLRPGRIGSLALDHRMLMGAMHLGIEGDRSQLGQLAAFYEERVRGGAALIVTGHAAVLPEGGGHGMYDLTAADHRDQLRELAGRIRAAGGKLALQLTHTGRYARGEETGLAPRAPSAIASRLTRETPEAMTLADVARVQEAFAEGAAFARDAGFHAIEIMGSEGYLLNEFMSPLTNARDDGYGGTLEGRIRMSAEVVARIRERVGRGFPVIFRMSGDDCMDGSTTPAETLALARALERSGADALNVGIGWHESRLPTVGATVPAGAFAHIVGAVRGAVGIPVIGANRLHTPEAAEQALARGDMDFVAPARPWLADPEFARKILQADRDGLNVCLACNQACLDQAFARKTVGCLVNPRAGREAEPFVRAAAPLTVAVVGGGVAGLQAAKTAAERGHAVTLFEARERLGGQFLLASRIPGKAVFRETLRYYTVALQRLGVDVRTNASPSADDLRAFDRVVVATGVQPHVPETLAGADLPLVCTYAELLAGGRPLGRRIVIVGGGGIGSDVAHYVAETAALRPDVHAFFAERGYAAAPAQAAPVRVTLVSRSEKVAKGVGVTTRWVLLEELKRRGVDVLKGYRCRAVVPGGVWVENDAEERFLEADQVVLCTGQRSRTEWMGLLREGGRRPDVVGGASDAAELNAARAIRQAYEIAMTL